MCDGSQLQTVFQPENRPNTHLHTINLFSEAVALHLREPDRKRSFQKILVNLNLTRRHYEKHSRMLRTDLLVSLGYLGAMNRAKHI